MHQAEIIVLLFAAVAALVVVTRKLAPDSFARDWIGACYNGHNRVGGAHHCTGYPLGGRICAWGNCFASRCDCGNIRDPPAFRSAPHPNNPEGESLVNDATALVALQFAIAALMTGTFSLGHAALRFVWVAAGGIAFGLLIGFAMRWVQRHLDDPPVQITISLLTPFAAYLPAERLHASGILATVAARIYLGWHSPLVISARTRLQLYAFWEMVVFLLNGFVFIVIGLQLPGILRALHGESLIGPIANALIISGAVILIRIAWVIPATYLPRWFSRKLRTRDPVPPWRCIALLAWSGIRGVVSLAAAFALPLALNDGSAFPERNYILFLTFSVILATLVLQGLTLPVLIRKLGIKGDSITDEEERTARLEANKAPLELIGKVAATTTSRPMSSIACARNTTNAWSSCSFVLEIQKIAAARSPRRNTSDCSRKR
jgi:CPA1 family monovalent cation:H+ antiporter